MELAEDVEKEACGNGMIAKTNDKHKCSLKKKQKKIMKELMFVLLMHTIFRICGIVACYKYVSCYSYETCRLTSAPNSDVIT